MWILLALGAAMLWGVNYALSGHVLRSLTPSGLMALLSACQLALFGGIVAARGELGQYAPRALGPDAWAVAGLVASAAAANWCIATSIQGRNATVAALVEMSYPLFTAAFAWAAFRETHLNATTAAGGIMILAGVAIVAAGSR